MTLRLPKGLLVSLVSVGLNYNAQETPFHKSAKESFHFLPEGQMKREVAAFTMASGQTGDRDSLTAPLLDVIPLLHNNDSTVEFFRDQIYVKVQRSFFDVQAYVPTDADTINDDLKIMKSHPFLGLSGDFPHTTITSFYVQNGKTEIPIPASSYRLLLDPNFFLDIPSHNFNESYCFVYRSKDKRRIYIYMINGDSSATYEVTWILEDNRYLRRVVDRHT